MATPGRTQDPGLAESPIEQALREDACSFEFFQAVSLLRRLTGDRQPVGGFFHPEAECVRFAVNNELAFPASQVEAIDWSEENAPRMKVNFMGLTGPMGVLPYCYTELILERSRTKDGTLATFLDIFNHRAISLFYRAWEKHRFPVTYRLGDADSFSQHLSDLIGIGTIGLQNRQSVPDEALLHYTGLVATQARSAAGLEQMVEDYFEVPAKVEQYVGAWYSLDRKTQCQFEGTDSGSEQLGGGAVVGDQIWDQQSRIRLTLGPLTLQQYQDFLPGGTALEPLKALTRFYCNHEFDVEVQLVLKREEAPQVELGSEQDEAPRLGWGTWLKTRPIERDPDETILSL
jgi:type VI secretion system protein ImpH